MPKKIFTQEMEGIIRRGIPQKRWKEKIERDLQALGVRKWRMIVADTKKWKGIFRKVKADWLQCQWKKNEKVVSD